MLPNIHIGSVKISMYYLAIFLGYALMVVLMMLPRRRARYRITKAEGAAIATFVLIIGLLGCKLLYVLENLDYIRKNGFTLGGFSFFGAVILEPILLPLFGKLFRLRFSESTDNAAVCALGMLGTIRLGCFFNGCCGGCVFYLERFDYYLSFPTQLMECVCDYMILLCLLRFESVSDKPGRLYGRFLLGYGVIRFLLEFLRSTEKDWLFLSHAQWFSLIAIVIAVALEFGFRQRDKRESNLLSNAEQ